ncbi:MAG: quinone oxidoreductase family protein [Alphaproteobacteria bacterium]
MAHAIRVQQSGGPDVLQWREVSVPEPGPGEVHLRQTAVGLNYIDIYVRTGLYPVPQWPTGIGGEAAGVVVSVGPNVSSFAPGDRVAYAGGPLGAYAQERVFPADRLVKLPPGLEETTAAAIMLQGMTVQYLIRQTFRVESGMTVLFHAAAGGVGLIACQWLNSLGVTVIGTVGSAAKAELAASNGCRHVINYNEENFTDRVMEITDGKGVPVVYDSVGTDTFEGSLSALARRGMLVTFGNASGKVPAFEPLRLSKGSLFITRPTLFDYVASREELDATAADLFSVVASGAVKPVLGQRYALRDAAQAHRDLEARKTTGSTILLP